MPKNGNVRVPRKLEKPFEAHFVATPGACEQMNWLKRGNRLYLYLARWQGGKRCNVYVGPEGSPAACRALERERARQEAMCMERSELAQIQAQWTSVQQQLQQLGELLDRLLTALLLAEGYHRADRHPWKARRAS